MIFTKNLKDKHAFELGKKSMPLKDMALNFFNAKIASKASKTSKTSIQSPCQNGFHSIDRRIMYATHAFHKVETTTLRTYLQNPMLYGLDLSSREV